MKSITEDLSNTICFTCGVQVTIFATKLGDENKSQRRPNEMRTSLLN